MVSPSSHQAPHAGRTSRHDPYRQPASLSDANGPVVTVCSGCPSECAFYANIDDAGHVFATFPVAGHPCRTDRLCGRGKRRLRLPWTQEDRIVEPLKRTSSGEFEPIGWDSAYREIAARVQQVIGTHGATTLACTTGLSAYFSEYAKRLLYALGSPNFYGVDAACEASRITAWEHTLGYSPETDIEHAQCVVYMGRSAIDSSSTEQANLVEKARLRGARIISVDPRNTSTGNLASAWLMVRPGYDLAFLLALAHELIDKELYDHAFVERYTSGFDEFVQAMNPYTAEWAEELCDIPAAQIREVAHNLAKARPQAVIDAGLHGGIGTAYANSTQTTRMIVLLNALLGCYGHEGGCLNPPCDIPLGTLDELQFPTPAVPQVPKAGASRYPLADARDGLCTTIGESIELGEIHALIAYASNPAMGYGNAQDWSHILGKLDLLVTIDIRMSETALLSDYILPDVTFLECDRGVGSRDSSLFYRNRVVKPLNPKTRPADRIFRGLASALDVGRYLDFSVDDLAKAQIAPYGVNLAELKEFGFADTELPLISRTGEPVITTPSGKIEFASDIWEQAGLGRVPFWQPPLVEIEGDRAFRLISGNSPFESHTSTSMLTGSEGDPAYSRLASVWINSSRATSLGIAEGDPIEVISDLGSDHAFACLTPNLHPEALFTNASPGSRRGKHATSQHAGKDSYGVGPFDHTPYRIDPITGAALTQENCVFVRKLTD